jgi:TonB family protein
MRQYRFIVWLFAILLLVGLPLVSQVDASSEDLSKGKIFRTADDQQSIKIISSDELELTRDHAGPHFVCKYSKESESLRVVATVLGTTQALYFKVTDQGLESDDQTIFYDSAHFEEARRKAIVANIVKASPTPIPPPPGVMPISVARTFAVFAPGPAYPYEARVKHITGSGVVLVTVDVATGVVTDTRMEPSFGNPLLDNCALSAFRRWRFKPGTVSKTKIPITFTLEGASY